MPSFGMYSDSLLVANYTMVDVLVVYIGYYIILTAYLTNQQP